MPERQVLPVSGRYFQGLALVEEGFLGRGLNLATFSILVVSEARLKQVGSRRLCHGVGMGLGFFPWVVGVRAEANGMALPCPGLDTFSPFDFY